MAANLRRGGPLESLITAPEEDALSTHELMNREKDLLPSARVEEGVVGDFRGGLRSGATGTQAGAMYREADFAEEDGDLQAADILRQQARNFERQGAQYAPRVQSLADVNDFDDALDFAQGALGQLAPTMAKTTAPALVGGAIGGIVGGPVGAAAGAAAFGAVPGYQMEAGEAAASQQNDEFIRHNVSVQQRLKEQRRKGAQGAAIELVFPTVVGGRLANSVSKIFTKLGKEGAEDTLEAIAKKGKTLKNQGRANIAQETATEAAPSIYSEIAKETLIEGATEGAQTVVGQMSLSRLNPNRDRTGDVQEIIDSVVMGALGGGGISLSTSVPGALVSSYQDYRAGKEAELPDAPKGEQAPPSTQEPRVPPGANVPESKLDNAAEAGQESVPITRSEADLDREAQGELFPEDQPVVKSEAELDREARVKKSVFGTRIPTDTKAEPVLETATAEELGGLRELKPFSKDASKGQNRYVRRTTQDTEAFLKQQVERGVITQEVADSSTIEPLGQSMKRKKASVQEMENTIAGIVRDLMTRIESNKKKGDTDMVKALTSELAALPIDIAKKGEVTYTAPIIGEEVSTVEKKKTGSKVQGDLFPETIGQKFPVPVKEFRRNHFGNEIVLKQPEQGELGLAQAESHAELLQRALDNYSVVLASGAAREASGTDVNKAKQQRRGLDVGTKEQKAELTPIRLMKKNGQVELVTAEDLARVELNETGGRGATMADARSKSAENEAARLSALAQHLMRKDVDGIEYVNPKTGKKKILKGAEASRHLQQWLKGKPTARRALQNQERTATGGYGLQGIKEEDRQVYMVESNTRQKIQRGFQAARKRLLKDASVDFNLESEGTLSSKGALKQTAEQREASRLAKEGETKKQVVKKWERMRDAQKKEAKRLRDLVAETNKLEKHIKETEGEMVPDFFEAWKEAVIAAAPMEVQAMLGEKYQKGTSKMRADRLDALAADIQELLNEQKKRDADTTLVKRQKTVEGTAETVAAETGELAIEQAEAAAEGKIRYAEDPTGADTVLAVGTAFRGQNKQKQVVASTKEDKQLKLFADSDGKGATTVVFGPSAKGTGFKGSPIAQAINRVSLVVAKADLSSFAGSRAMEEIVYRGLEVVLPHTNTAVQKAMAANGYVEQQQPGGVMYTPAIGQSEPDLNNRKPSMHGNVDPALADAINTKERKRKQDRISDYIAKVLGDRFELIWEDMKSDSDASGYFDWKKKVISLALNSTNAEGTARHEAFHGFINALGKLDGQRDVYDRLLKAANAPHIKRQLRKLLANNPEALKQLRDPEERAAYMFQFYASRQLHVQPQTFKTLRKWAKNLARLAGYVTRMDAAEAIFEAFNEGHLQSDKQIADMIREQQHVGLAKEINNIVVKPTRAALTNTLLTATDRLRITNNKSLTKLADMYATVVKEGGLVGYIQMRQQKESQINNAFNDIIEKNLEGEKDPKKRDKIVNEALEDLQSMKADDDLSPMAKEIRRELKVLFTYLRDAHNDSPVLDKDGNPQLDENGDPMIDYSKNAVQYIAGFHKDEDGNPDYGRPKWEPIKFTERYFPRVWDATSIIADWPKFSALLKKHGELDAQTIEDFKNAIQAGDGMLDLSTQNPTFDAAMRAVNERAFTFINEENASEFAAYQEKDMTKILTTYARQAAHRGEQTRHFGYNNQKVDQLLADAKEEGATAQELETADKALRALEGTLGHENMNPLIKNAMMTGMTIVNLSALPLALFASLVDPLGVAVRTGDFKQAGKTFMAASQQIIDDVRGLDDTNKLFELKYKAAMEGDNKKFKKLSKRIERAEMNKLAKFLGIIEQEQTLSIIGDSYNSMFANEGLQRINTRFFKAIGLDSWTKGTRIGAMVATMEYLKEYQNDQKRLDELGLKKGDVQLTQDGQIEVTAAVLGQEKSRRVQSAIYRMVDEAILRPTAAQRPIFMSDMRFMLLGHLKQFTFSFHNTIIKQVAANINDNIDNQDYGRAMTQLIPLISYVPFMMAADILRSLVGGRIDDEDREPSEFLWDGVQRSGAMGLYTFGMDAIDDIGYGGAPVNTMLGPVIHKGAKLAHSAIDPGVSFPASSDSFAPRICVLEGLA